MFLEGELNQLMCVPLPQPKRKQTHNRHLVIGSQTARVLQAVLDGHTKQSDIADAAGVTPNAAWKMLDNLQDVHKKVRREGKCRSTKWVSVIDNDKN